MNYYDHSDLLSEVFLVLLRLVLVEIASRGQKRTSKIKKEAREVTVIFEIITLRVHAKGVVLSERACFCLLSTF